MSRRPREPEQLTLGGVKVPKSALPKTSTAIYQGVCAQIRALFPVRDVDPDTAADSRRQLRRYAGTIAQARSLAASIDRVAGDGGYQAAGMQLSAMHERLDALLARLDPDGKSDPFLDLIRQLQDDDDAPAEVDP